MILKKYTYHIQNIDKIIGFFIKIIRIKKNIIISGDTGTGKTTIIKKIILTLSKKNNITSPSFSMCNIYKAQKYIIEHFDLYKINSIKELFLLDINKYKKNHITIVETNNLIGIKELNNYECVRVYLNLYFCKHARKIYFIY